MAHASASFEALSPLARRRLRREQRRRQKKRATAAAAAALVLVAVAGLAWSRDGDRQPDVSGRTEVRTGPATAGRRSADLHRPGTTAQEPIRRPPPTSTPAAATSAPITRPVPPASTGPRRPVQPTTPAFAPLPPAAAAVAGDIDPQSPPSTPPVGAQGPVRTTACASTGVPQVRPSVVDAPSTQGGWVTVGRLAGNCGSESGSVPLAGLEARLVYRSDASAFQVFLTDQADPSTSSGYADVECDASCAGVQDLTDQAGRYRIKVAASDAPWEVLVQEYR